MDIKWKANYIFYEKKLINYFKWEKFGMLKIFQRVKAHKSDHFDDWGLENYFRGALKGFFLNINDHQFGPKNLELQIKCLLNVAHI